MSCNGCSLSSKNSFYDQVLNYHKNQGKLETLDWLADLPNSINESDIVEVKFKNTRKAYYRNRQELPLKRGCVVAVEASPGRDIGIVSLTGRLAKMQWERRTNRKPDFEWKEIYRIAREQDIVTWQEAKDREKEILIEARKLAQEQALDMKITDVDVQGDNAKAIFYYIADGRVDFRQLIRRYASVFSLRVEMKQIGSRQEAGLIGGIGSCGRELCCSTWRTDFSSVSTQAARLQQLPINAQKLAGQCGKLKCCLTYELDNYLENWQDFPKQLIELETKQGIYLPVKRDILAKQVYYGLKGTATGELIKLSIDEVKQLLKLNKKGIIPVTLKNEDNETKSVSFTSGTSEIDTKKPVKRKPKKRKRNKASGKRK
jgi:cell fate regulator YaaT (PSP1 superfamily)